MSPPISLLLLALASLSTAQPTTIPIATTSAPAAAAGPPPPAATAAIDTADPFDCDTDASTNCLQPDYFPTDFAYNATATATTVETLAFTEVSTTEYVVATETLYSDGSIDAYYPDDNSTDSTLDEDGDDEDGDDIYYYGDDSGGNYTETYTETVSGTVPGAAPIVTTFTETYFDDGSDTDEYYSTGLYAYNDSAPIVYTYTETTTAANPNGGKPINVVQTVTTTVDVFEDSYATAEPAGTEAGTSVMPNTAAPGVAPLTTSGVAPPGITNGPIGGNIAMGAASPAERNKKNKQRRNDGSGGVRMQRRKRIVRY